MSTDPLARVRRQLRTQLRERVDARGLSSAPRTERRLLVREEAMTLMRESGALLPQRDLARVVNEVSDEVVAFGPIEFLLKDPEVTEEIRDGLSDSYCRARSNVASAISIHAPRHRKRFGQPENAYIRDLMGGLRHSY